MQEKGMTGRNPTDPNHTITKRRIIRNILALSTLSTSHDAMTKKKVRRPQKSVKQRHHQKVQEVPRWPLWEKNQKQRKPQPNEEQPKEEEPLSKQEEPPKATPKLQKATKEDRPYACK
eukprot:61233_1